MSTITDYFIQSELALAAYATLTSGTPDIQALQENGKGMSAAQAAAFASNWTVLAPTFTDPATGVSATIFGNNLTGQTTLAIRGTELSGTDLTADGLLALGLPSNLNPQFTALKTQIDAWLTDGTLGGSFTVSGHSLGGYLAAAVKQTYSQVTDAYLFNAPGVGGVLGNLTDALTSALGLSSAPAGNIWNVRGSEGFPIISGLGYQLGTPIAIQTEAADNPLNNHSIVALIDALAIQSLYSQLSPDLSQEQLNILIDASGTGNATTLEDALDALRVLMFGPSTVQTQLGDRDALYANLYALQDNAAFTGLTGAASLTLLTDMSSGGMTALAKSNGAQGLAARYALVALNPFVLAGADYSVFNTNGALERYDSGTGTGALTDRYLTDRADLLERKIWFSTQDKDPVDPSVVFDSNNHPFQNESAYYEDVASGYRIQQGGLFNNTRRYFFGGSGSDTYTGSGVEDHLYGGTGNDTLTGSGGNDYLEGGQGYDTYLINTGDGTDTILDVDGIGAIVLDGLTLTGGALVDGTANVWKDTANGITYTLQGTGANQILIIGKDGSDTGLRIQGWQAGQLGLAMSGTIAPPAAATLTGADGYSDALTGTAGSDRILGLSGNDALDGSGGDDILEGGLGDDLLAGGAGSDIIHGGAGRDMILSATGLNLPGRLDSNGEWAAPASAGAIWTQGRLWGIYASSDANGPTYIIDGSGSLGQDSAGDIVFAGDDDDRVIGGLGDDYIDGGQGNDSLTGHGGNDVIEGGDGEDYIQGDGVILPGYYTSVAGIQHGNDVLDGGADADILVGGGGGDALFGGTGNDMLWGDNENETLLGGQYHGSDYLDGGDGNDQLVGGGGDDILVGGIGSDLIYGGAERDMILSAAGLALQPQKDRNNNGIPDDWAPPAGAGAVWTSGRLWGIYDDSQGNERRGGGQKCRNRTSAPFICRL